MRLTINLDSDLHAVAKSLARELDCSISKAVNRLLRRGLDQQAPPEPTRGRRSAVSKGKAGLPSVRCDRTFTSDEVYRLDQETT